MRILLLVEQLERGGAGRVAAIQCNGLYRRGYDVVLATDHNNFSINYSIDAGIPRMAIVTKSLHAGYLEKLRKMYRCIKDVRKYIKKEKPNLIIAVQPTMFLYAYLGNVGLHVPLIVADHTSFDRKLGLLKNYVRFHLYKKADAISILTQRDARILGCKFSQKRVIYNPLPFPVLNHPTERRHNILCAGRLEVWDIKGFDIIIKIWSEIHNSYPNWVLEIAGDSDTAAATEAIRKMIIDNHVEHRVRLLGNVENMKSLYCESGIFALSSRMEGFPLVLMEAMSQGCSCIAFDINGASSEMMEQDAGIIVKDGDWESFKNGLVKLIENEPMRRTYGNNAIKSVSRFSVNSFIDNWEQLIHDIL